MAQPKSPSYEVGMVELNNGFVVSGRKLSSNREVSGSKTSTIVRDHILVGILAKLHSEGLKIHSGPISLSKVGQQSKAIRVKLKSLPTLSSDSMSLIGVVTG